MVFLTTQLWLRSRVTDRYWRVQEVLKHARHFRGRKNRCYRLAVRAVIRAFVKCTKARRRKRGILRTVSRGPGARRPSRLGRRVTAGRGAWPPPSALAGPTAASARPRPPAAEAETSAPFSRPLFLSSHASHPKPRGTRWPGSPLRPTRPLCPLLSSPPPAAPRGFPSHPTR
uniref:Mitochondrial ribosomal protein L20 n=1 Tax=Myotis myotis TaxID=51298 RepID=A0A7J7QWG7_MYOMY|nr:mitochondrial ribosomal protein L20 [Myotis myotis]